MFGGKSKLRDFDKKEFLASEGNIPERNVEPEMCEELVEGGKLSVPMPECRPEKSIVTLDLSGGQSLPCSSAFACTSCWGWKSMSDK